MIQEKVKDLAKRKLYPESVAEEVSRIFEVKAEGIFLWIGIAHGDLAQPEVQSRNAVKILGQIQPRLYALYRQLLNKALVSRDDNNNDKITIVNLISFVAFARQPLCWSLRSFVNYTLIIIRLAAFSLLKSSLSYAA